MLGSILELVRRRVSFSETEDSEIVSMAQEICIELEKPFGKLFSDFLDYSDLERLLIADLTAYRFLDFQVTKKLSTTVDGVIKKVKADVVEVEYDTNLTTNASKFLILDKLKKGACAKAYTLGFRLAICEDNLVDFPTPFQVFM